MTVAGCEDVSVPNLTSAITTRLARPVWHPELAAQQRHPDPATRLTCPAHPATTPPSSTLALAKHDVQLMCSAGHVKNVHHLQLDKLWTVSKAMVEPVGARHDSICWAPAPVCQSIRQQQQTTQQRLTQHMAR